MFKYFGLLLIPLLLSLAGCTGQAKVQTGQYQQSLKAELQIDGDVIKYKEKFYKNTGGYRRVSNNDNEQLVELNRIKEKEFYIDKEEIDFPTKIYVTLDASEFYDVYKLENGF